MDLLFVMCFFFFSSRRRHTRLVSDWSSDVCSSDLIAVDVADCDRHAAAKGRIVSEEGRLEVARNVKNAYVWAAADSRRRDDVGLAVEIGRASCRERGEMSGGV